ncbi:unnamed protein product [Dicrocoelium dendriticum]|nr:unnamed protein product [Dicrocoelium dendriticum]
MYPFSLVHDVPLHSRIFGHFGVMHSYFFSVFISVLLSLSSSLDSSPSELDYSHIFHSTANIDGSVVFPCTTAELNLNWTRIWYANDEPLKEIAGYRILLPNGSLSLRVRMEDSDIVYHCHIIGRFANGSEAMSDYFIFKVDPIVGAFLNPTVENVTVDWGTVYAFPCGFAGTLPREETMILNHKVVTERYHNITEDSVVECSVKNRAGSAHDVAYITITPGSKEWALDHGVPTSSYCQPYSATLQQRAVCSPYLDSTQPHPRGSAYLVARSRLYVANITESALAQLFNAWDDLLVREQSSRFPPLDSPISSNGSQPMRLAYTALRCVELAKYLACVLAYPKCRPLDGDWSSFDLFSNELYREDPICQSHCLAITGLFCLSALDADEHATSLGPLFINHSDGTSSSPMTGWAQLAQVPEMKLPGLPSSFSNLAYKHTGFAALQTCGAMDHDRPSLLIDPQKECASITLDKPFSVPEKFTSHQFDVQIPEDHSTDRCVSGDGRGYRGSETNTNCHPWDATGYVLASGSTTDSVSWPVLAALNPHAFPSVLGGKTSATSACRNPAGLAPAPFCIGPSLNSLPVDSQMTVSSPNPLEFRIYLCSEIPHCSSLSASVFWNANVAVSKEDYALAQSTVKTQVTIACVLLVCLVCIISILSVLWRSNRCCALHSMDSDPCSSELDEKTQVTESVDVTKSCKWSAKGFDDAPEQLYVRHRLQWVRRRRRLRQLNPACQCLLGCWYVFTDWITCKSNQPQPDPCLHLMSPAGSGDSPYDAPVASVLTPDDTIDKPVSSSPGCCLPLVHTVLLSKSRRNQSSPKQPHSTKCCPQFSWFTNSLSHRTDDEFESNALRMHLQKSVARVANASTSPTRVSSVTGSGTSLGFCKNCACRTECMRGGRKLPTTYNNKRCQVCLHDDSEHLPLQYGEQDPGSALTKSSLRLINAAPSDLGSALIPGKLFNMASMTNLLHPKLKQMCYPRNRLVEVKRLAKRSFGWVVLAHAPDMHHLMRRHRMLSVTSADWLGLSSANDQQATTDVPQGDYDLAPSTPMQDTPYVVVKTLTADASVETEANFLREAEVLVELSHGNIIRLLGVCLPLKPLSLLLEYMPFGDLSSFLKHYQHSTETSHMYPLHLVGSLLAGVNGEIASGLPSAAETVCPALAGAHEQKKSLWLPPANLHCTHLLTMARDACEAMVYLSDNYYVHRDVATRSFLVGNNMIIKLADFFMCRPIQPNVDFVAAEDIYLPIRWLPLESILHGLFHVDTDVWSFGVFLWELFTYASEPYTDMSHAEVIGYLETGGRLPCPASCPPAVYELMHSCWNAQRNERPSFNVLRLRLQEIVSQLAHPV